MVGHDRGWEARAHERERHEGSVPVVKVEFGTLGGRREAGGGIDGEIQGVMVGRRPARDECPREG
eukprot:scaffold2216_cov72-Isochrysis_galbana.AAC.2